MQWVQHQDDWDSLIPLSPGFLPSTIQWLDSEWSLRVVSIVLPPPQVELFTDAFLIDRGTDLNPHILHLWSDAQASHHFNWLELGLVCLTLPEFASQTVLGHVLLRTDNTTVACFSTSKRGGSRSPVLFRLTKNLLPWCQDYNICLTALLFSGSTDIFAIQLSRAHLILQTEWTLVTLVLVPV